MKGERLTASLCRLHVRDALTTLQAASDTALDLADDDCIAVAMGLSQCRTILETLDRRLLRCEKGGK